MNIYLKMCQLYISIVPDQIMMSLSQPGFGFNVPHSAVTRPLLLPLLYLFYAKISL